MTRMPIRPEDKQAVNRSAYVRILLGNLQMFGAVFSFVLLIESSINIYTLTAVLLTTCLTIVSLFAFRRERRRVSPRQEESKE